jgi:hypothetical protein
MAFFLDNAVQENVVTRHKWSAPFAGLDAEKRTISVAAKCGWSRGLEGYAFRIMRISKEETLDQWDIGGSGNHLKQNRIARAARNTEEFPR